MALFFRKVKDLKMKKLFENTFTSKIRSLAIGLVEIKTTLKNISALIYDSNEGTFIISDKFEKELAEEYVGQSFFIPLSIIL